MPSKNAPRTGNAARILFIVMAVIVIASMILSLVINL